VSYAVLVRVPAALPLAPTFTLVAMGDDGRLHHSELRTMTAAANAAAGGAGGGRAMMDSSD
jgi:hypothetical protein